MKEIQQNVKKKKQLECKRIHSDFCKIVPIHSLNFPD